MTEAESDPIHPQHYRQSQTGYQAIDFMELMNCPNLADAFKYVWRHEYKGKPEEDLDKALWYIDREVALRARWTRPLRFDLSTGHPVGHMDEDDVMFEDFRSKSEESTPLSILTALWYADMTPGASTLSLGRKLLAEMIEKRES